MYFEVKQIFYVSNCLRKTTISRMHNICVGTVKEHFDWMDLLNKYAPSLNESLFESEQDLFHKLFVNQLNFLTIYN